MGDAKNRATCWRLCAGRWTGRTIEDDTLELAELRHAPDTALPCAVDGRDDENWEVTRILVGEVISRVAPHSIWYFAPGFFGCQAPGDSWGALAHRTGSIVTLRTDASELWTVSTAYHESWHVLESLLTRHELAAVDAAVARGGAWQDGYHDSAAERRARAFEGWAMARHEAPAADRSGTVGRLLDAVHRWTAPAHEKVFLDAFTGCIGRRAAARRWISSTRLSPAAQARAAADRDASRDRRIQDGCWAAIAASLLAVVGMVARHWLA